MTRTTTEYIAAGGNRHSSAADWATGLLAFGAGNNIALWNPEDERQAGVSSLLAGHSDTVNAVKIYENGSDRYILSGSADKTIRVWSDTSSTVSGFRETQCLSEHAGSINTLAILQQRHIFVSGAADGTVNVWSFKDGAASLVQSIALKPRYLPLALAVTSLPNEDLLLAVAGTSTVIQLFVKSKDAEGFEFQATLSGHESWIRSLDFTHECNAPHSDVLLASASQDRYIRLWRFRQGQNVMQAGNDIASGLSVQTDAKSLSNKAHQVGRPDSKYSVTFEALLIGHEDWVYTARWGPRGSRTSAPVLLSASADNSLAIWSADSATGLWVCTSRLGEISSLKGSTSATGSTGGFWTGLWQSEGQSVVSLGRTGSWRCWTFDPINDMWVQKTGISGHVLEVQGIAWSTAGNWLLSTSSDQTTRLIAEWRREARSSWHEFSRPQIHGYDLNCVDAISENRFISGADEKLLRVFNKPKAVDALIAELGSIAASVIDDLPDAANIPVLGLSNKAVAATGAGETINGVDNGDAEDDDNVDSTSGVRKTTLDLAHPPLEDHLARYTLWPEHEKLYGHGYEISAVTTSSDGKIVATACKASSIDHAVIRLYDTQEWREVKPALTAHSLTVTSLSFSRDDRFLLSVGRDRQWAIFERSKDDFKTYLPLAANPKGHSRMILDCCWAPLRAGHVFATAGRDKTVKIWRLDDGNAECKATLAAGASVTAVAFEAEPTPSGALLLAYGNEEGVISLVSLDCRSYEVLSTERLDRSISPSGTINTLRWRPRPSRAESTARTICHLASASDDFSVRIYNVEVT
ncbi:uncharacterized protein MYCGRDRAFT_55066 [Zymoseptoria tritici IPO323]|uniref:Elongator complex protein 2 n=1 Tax=Zymoseptoria tritici (strain CBS 115943 / IPO323) TaxID=336722 RepID=F9X498_ZYMTI|nr:uncharacterized protein MYCGRDRAFT_55066 [Zymoseptoria tritici IPO323]EGP90605.1 hypothetical protein MYCGRDRAFT_55066 [Zymoseptoria tritici IPO323]